VDVASPVAAHVDRPKGRGPRWLIAGSAIGVVLVAGGIWWSLQSPTAQPARPVREEPSATAAEARPGATPDAAGAPNPAVPAADARFASPPTPETVPADTPPVPAQTARPIREPAPATVEPVPVTPARTEPVPVTPAPLESVPVSPPPVEPIPVPAPPPVEPVPVAPPPAAATRRSTPRDAGTATPARPERPAPRAAEGARKERPQAESSNAAECARIMQRLSLGESSQQLLERLKVLKCQ